MLQMPCPRCLAATPDTNTTWVDAWASSYISTTINGKQQAAPTFNNQTLRFNLFTKLGGAAVRVQFTDLFATNPVVIGEAHVAWRSPTGGSGIVPATDQVLTFDGATNLTLAVGEERWSDPVDLAVTQHQELTVSLFLPQSIKPTTCHPVGLKTHYYVAGNHCGDATLVSPKTITTNFFVSGLQVMAPANSRVIVALGDSITDGTSSSTDANGPWPDALSKRLPSLPDGTPVGVVNMGIGSNRLVTTNAAGPSGLDRLDHDVLSRANVSHLVLLEGINDISYEQVLPEDLIAAYQQVIDRAHAKGIKVLGATMLPIGNSTKYTPANEATRQTVNTWVRESGRFDAVLDFEKAVADTNYTPLRIKAAYNSGDFVHPNTAGYQAMADSVPLDLFNAQIGTFYAPGFDTNGLVRWWLDLDPGRNYVVEASTNFADWTTFLNMANAPAILLSDPDSKTQPLRFFRARQLP